VLTRDGYVRPGHIVGLTAFENIFDEAGSVFEKELWSLVFYDPSSQTWIDMIQAKCRHILASNNAQSDRPEFGCDFCIVTALQDPELDAVLNLPWDWHVAASNNDPTTYHHGAFATKTGLRRTAIAARAPSMGMPAAAILATKMALIHRPRSIIMTGICAGDATDTQLGDVIVANPSWDYGSGKHAVSDSLGKTFSPSHHQASLSSRMRSIVERMQLNRQELDAIRSRFSGRPSPSALNLHIGPLASGAAVLADSDLFNRVKEQHRKLLGVDMEAYAVMASAMEIPEPKPEVIVLKGVSDFANSAKDDSFRHYAAYTSANVLSVLATEFDL
jgi:nucleoside phosphorylase